MTETADVETAKKLLDAYFQSDGETRFTFKGLNGKGASALTWKISYMRIHRDPTTYYELPRAIVLKTAKKDSTRREVLRLQPNRLTAGGDVINPIENERKWLKHLEWAEHFAKLVPIPREPLRRATRSHAVNFPDYLYLEWVPYGTLWNFITRARRQGYSALPNRLLWRFFMCLIRMVIGMAWPPLGPEDWENQVPVIERVRGIRPNGLVHRDMHTNNIMFGYFENPAQNPEHDWIPTMKLIDFGEAKDVQETNEERNYIWRFYQGTERSRAIYGSDMSMWADWTRFDGDDWFNAAQRSRPIPIDRGVAKNVFDIGLIMLNLALLRKPIGQSRYEMKDIPGADIPTTAVELVTPDDSTGDYPNPDLDPTLRNVIARCLAVDPRRRPGPAALLDGVSKAIAERDVNFYNARARKGDPLDTESDDVIKQVVQDLILNASDSGLG